MNLHNYIFLAVVNVAIFILCEKWGVIRLYQFYKPKWMPVCNFCFFFWVAFLQLLIIWLAGFPSFEGLFYIPINALFCAVISTATTRFIYA